MVNELMERRIAGDENPPPETVISDWEPAVAPPMKMRKQNK